MPTSQKYNKTYDDFPRTPTSYILNSYYQVGTPINSFNSEPRGVVRRMTLQRLRNRFTNY